MPLPIEDYALLSDTESAALVGRDGSIDWLTFPRYDSAACFAALLGTPEHGRWLLAPAGGVQRVERRYIGHSLVLETVFHTADGVVAVIDTMPVRSEALDVARIVEGRSGRVPMRMQLVVRPDYGSIVPWAYRIDGGIRFVAGPDALVLRTPVDVQPDGWSHGATFEVGPGDRVPFELAWHPSHEPMPAPLDIEDEVAATLAWWTEWSKGCVHLENERWDDASLSSLVTLKGLTYRPTGGIVAAATTSLPEQLGGPRNWDYRFCWLRDATFTLLALMDAGFTEEAAAWREWLVRAVAGDPAEAQILYGVAGERRIPEAELPWLPGWLGASPVRTGNAAHSQFQLDVFGEVLDALHQARLSGVGELTSPGSSDPKGGSTWSLERALVDVVGQRWREPDNGLWEVRGGLKHFTHSKVMAWVAVDRAIRSAELAGLEAPLDRWRALRDRIHTDVLTHGVDDRGVLVQSYGSPELDASLLIVPAVGFLPPTDPRVHATVKAIQRELSEDGLVYRYRAERGVDGLPGGEGVFLLCSFWMVDALSAIGERDEARALFERLLDLRNDVGLLAEQYDPTNKRMLGNFPQAFSHVGLVTSAYALSRDDGQRRSPTSASAL